MFLLLLQLLLSTCISNGYDMFPKGFNEQDASFKAPSNNVNADYSKIDSGVTNCNNVLLHKTLVRVLFNKLDVHINLDELADAPRTVNLELELRINKEDYEILKSYAKSNSNFPTPEMVNELFSRTLYLFKKLSTSSTNLTWELPNVCPRLMMKCIASITAIFITISLIRIMHKRPVLSSIIILTLIAIIQQAYKTFIDKRAETEAVLSRFPMDAPESCKPYDERSYKQRFYDMFALRSDDECEKYHKVRMTSELAGINVIEIIIDFMCQPFIGIATNFGRAMSTFYHHGTERIPTHVFIVIVILFVVLFTFTLRYSVYFPPLPNKRKKKKFPALKKMHHQSLPNVLSSKPNN